MPDHAHGHTRHPQPKTEAHLPHDRRPNFDPRAMTRIITILPLQVPTAAASPRVRPGLTRAEARMIRTVAAVEVELSDAKRELQRWQERMVFGAAESGSLNECRSDIRRACASVQRLEAELRRATAPPAR